MLHMERVTGIELACSLGTKTQFVPPPILNAMHQKDMKLRKQRASN